jgi:hypothetical protein
VGNVLANQLPASRFLFCRRGFTLGIRPARFGRRGGKSHDDGRRQRAHIGQAEATARAGAAGLCARARVLSYASDALGDLAALIAGDAA